MSIRFNKAENRSINAKHEKTRNTEHTWIVKYMDGYIKYGRQKKL